MLWIKVKTIGYEEWAIGPISQLGLDDTVIQSLSEDGNVLQELAHWHHYDEYWEWDDTVVPESFQYSAANDFWVRSGRFPDQGCPWDGIEVVKL